jgi:hypothetical protein
MRQIEPPRKSVNQRAPSEPTVIPVGDGYRVPPCEGSRKVGTEYSVSVIPLIIVLETAVEANDLPSIATVGNVCNGASCCMPSGSGLVAWVARLIASAVLKCSASRNSRVVPVEEAAPPSEPAAPAHPVTKITSNPMVRVVRDAKYDDLTRRQTLRDDATSSADKVSAAAKPHVSG